MNAQILKHFDDKYKILSDLSEKYHNKIEQTKKELNDTSSTLKLQMQLCNDSEYQTALKQINDAKTLLETDLQDVKSDLKILNRIGDFDGVNQEEIKNNLFADKTEVDQEFRAYFSEIGSSVQKIQQEINKLN